MNKTTLMTQSSKVRVFLDTSALFSAVYSTIGGARLILMLGKEESISLLASSDVFAEAEEALRRKTPDLLGMLALLLQRSNIKAVPAPSEATIHKCHILIGYLADAQVLAAAWDSSVDYFVTLDRQHFLNNAELRSAVPFPIGTPGDFLAWFRERLLSEDNDR